MRKINYWLFRTSILLISIAIALPLIPLLLSSFSYRWGWPEVWPRAFGLRAWQYVFSPGAGTSGAIWLSIKIALLVTLLDLVAAVPGAYVLARMNFRGKIFLEGILFAPLVVPPFVSTMGIHVTFLRLGLTESVIGVVLSHLVPTLPYMLAALIPSFKTFSAQLNEQARMLGAGRWQRFWHIILPHMLPGVLAGSSLTVLISLSQYLITFLIGGGQVMTLPLILFPFINGGDPAIGSAYALLFAAMAGMTLWGMYHLLNRYYGNRIRLHL